MQKLPIVKVSVVVLWQSYDKSYYDPQNEKNLLLITYIAH